MNNNYMVTAQDVVEMLGVSKGHAYKIIRQLNKELEVILQCPARFPEHIGTRNFMGIKAERQQLNRWSEYHSDIQDMRLKRKRKFKGSPAGLIL